MAVQGYSQPTPSLPNKPAGDLLVGEHYPVLYTGQGLIRGTAHPCTTAWLQVGYSPSASEADNRNIGIFNPEVFTIGMKLSTWGNGDSAQVQAARFECAYDTSASPFWNSDSSNLFVTSDAFDHPDYGQWRFEPLSNTSRRWLFPARLLIGGYVRLILESEIGDTCQVDWSLICEH